MQFLIFLCLVAGAFAGKECGPHAHYNSCGTACPLTCRNYKSPPQACVLMCNPGCHCDEGYVLADNGDCVLPEECPAQAEKSCLEKPDTGMCRGYFPMFYYDAVAGTCKEFIYGGCQGNGNRFATESECLSTCGDVKVWKSSSRCEQPIESGPCMALLHRYGFDKESGKCKKFIYGGCKGNENNFESIDECRKTCLSESALRRPDCDMDADPGLCFASFTRYYYADGECKKFVYGGCGGNRNNFKSEEECYNKCGALAAPTACQMEKVVGPCKAAFPRYYFNTETRQCEKFIYGGCQGNSNNFEDKEDCETVCLGK